MRPRDDPDGDEPVSASDIFERRRNYRRRVREREEQVARAVGRKKRLVRALGAELRDDHDGIDDAAALASVLGENVSPDDESDYIARERLLLKNELLERDRQDLAAENRALVKQNAYAK